MRRDLKDRKSWASFDESRTPGPKGVRCKNINTQIISIKVKNTLRDSRLYVCKFIVSKSFDTIKGEKIDDC